MLMESSNAVHDALLKVPERTDHTFKLPVRSYSEPRFPLNKC
jgi:hypothetical protein